MTTDIIITGAAGFIGSCVAQHFRLQGYQLLLVDDFSKVEKKANTSQFSNSIKIDRTTFINHIDDYSCKQMIHLGARTDTTEMDYKIHEELNLNYSKKIWHYCIKHNIQLLYASSAATYGNGEHGYKDNHEIIDQLTPLNPYGISKNEFDKWAIAQKEQPKQWQGLKFFNVFGPNEYHKGRMASVIFHAYHQVKKTQAMKLFKSHHADYENGEQQRDFVYVKDVVSVIDWLAHNNIANGIYNLGTGKARTFKDLAQAVFASLNMESNISFIETPSDIRDNYQYFTKADMDKLIEAGYPNAFMSLEQAVQDYVTNYLTSEQYY